MRKIFVLSILTLVISFFSFQAYSVMSAQKFILSENKEVRKILTEYFLKQENKKLDDGVKVYIHTSAYPPEVKDKDYFINTNPHYTNSYMVVILAGSDWCNKSGCQLFSFEKKNNKWSKVYSTTSSGCYSVSDTIDRDKDGWFIGPYIADNNDGKTILFLEKKVKEVVYKGSSCKKPMQELKEYFK